MERMEKNIRKHRTREGMGEGGKDVDVFQDRQTA